MLRIVEHKGIRLSSVGIGTWTIGGPYWTNGEPTGWSGPLDDEDSICGLTFALEHGINHIDTADVYGHGRSERLVGKALSSAKTAAVVASKVGFLPTSAPSVYSPENIRFQCEQSLRNLGRDTIDLYYLHHCDFGPGDRFLDGAVSVLNELKRVGKIRSICLSGYSAGDLIRISKKLLPDFIQSWASFEHPEFIMPGGPLSAFMKESGIRFIAMMPFGQGRLLGKHNGQSPLTFGPGDTRSTNAEFSTTSLEAIEPKMALLRERFGQSPSDLIAPALGFILSHDVVASVVPGFRSSQQVREIYQAVQRPVSPEDLHYMAQLFPYSETNKHPWQE
jgi:aryl-alcohol dehydrogenase-like predicted oxidoreductase